MGISTDKIKANRIERTVVTRSLTTKLAGEPSPAKPIAVSFFKKKETA